MKRLRQLNAETRARDVPKDRPSRGECPGCLAKVLGVSEGGTWLSRVMHAISTKRLPDRCYRSQQGNPIDRVEVRAVAVFLCLWYGEDTLQRAHAIRVAG